MDKKEREEVVRMVDLTIHMEMEGYFGNGQADEQDKEIIRTVKLWQQVRALVEALPDGEVEEEPKHYRCESCGKDFDKKLFSHSRTEENQVGDPVEVECGPISEVK